MDKKLIEQYGTEILCYRLRTARQKKRIQYEDFDKWLIKQDKIWYDLWKRDRNPVWTPLDPPIQKGWKRYFVLKKGVTSGKQVEFFEGILKKINTYEWSYRKDFKVKRRKAGKKIYVVKEQFLLKLYDHVFERKDFSDEEKQFFYPTPRYYKGGREPSIVYIFSEPWRFELKVSPNMVTRQRMVDPNQTT